MFRVYGYLALIFRVLPVVHFRSLTVVGRWFSRRFDVNCQLLDGYFTIILRLFYGKLRIFDSFKGHFIVI